jgi:hypothetical protein
MMMNASEGQMTPFDETTLDAISRIFYRYKDPRYTGEIADSINNSMRTSVRVDRILASLRRHARAGRVQMIDPGKGLPKMWKMP